MAGSASAGVKSWVPQRSPRGLAGAWWMEPAVGRAFRVEGDSAPKKGGRPETVCACRILSARAEAGR